jgi:hypothetical protein
MVVLESSIMCTAEYQCILMKYKKWLTTKWYGEKKASVDLRYRIDLPHLALPLAAS